MFKWLDFVLSILATLPQIADWRARNGDLESSIGDLAGCNRDWRTLKACLCLFTVQRYEISESPCPTLSVDVRHGVFFVLVMVKNKNYHHLWLSEVVGYEPYLMRSVGFSLYGGV